MSVLPTALGLAWGALLAVPFARRARAAQPHARLAGLRPTQARDTTRTPGLRRWGYRIAAAVPGPVRRVLARARARRRQRAADDRIVAELPVTVDLLAVAVRAGCTPFLAVDTAARWAPPTLAELLHGVRRACTLGQSFGAALDDLATTAPALRPLVDALLASDRFGAPVGDALARVAAEQRTALRRRAETRARTVPVRLLFPLVFLVLPAFGLLTVIPAVLTGIGATT